VTLGASSTALRDITFTVHREGTALAELGSIEPVYASAYAEAPYNEGPDDVAEFGKGWPSRVAQPSFRLVVAWLATQPVGFTFGHQLTATTRWWRGLLDEVDDDIIAEYEGRTFAVIELAVIKSLRGHGIGRELHSCLLAGLTEARATLLVRPEATAARCAYLSWAYQPVGRVQPFVDGPVYEALVKALHR
jgi:GNAT superfamily N-acetyltransferase